jgi:hypothetical protein
MSNMRTPSFAPPTEYPPLPPLPPQVEPEPFVEPVFLSEPFDVETQDPGRACHLFVYEGGPVWCGHYASLALPASPERAREHRCSACGGRRCVACAEAYLSRR